MKKIIITNCILIILLSLSFCIDTNEKIDESCYKYAREYSIQYESSSGTKYISSGSADFNEKTFKETTLEIRDSDGRQSKSEYFYSSVEDFIAFGNPSLISNYLGFENRYTIDDYQSSIETYSIDSKKRKLSFSSNYNVKGVYTKWDSAGRRLEAELTNTEKAECKAGITYSYDDEEKIKTSISQNLSGDCFTTYMKTTNYDKNNNWIESYKEYDDASSVKKVRMITKTKSVCK